MMVQPFGEQALARAGFAQDEDRAVGVHDFARLLSQVPDCRAVARQWVDPLPPVTGRYHLLLSLQPSCGQQALEDQMQRRHFDGLGQELLCALLDGLHCQVDRPIRRQDNHRHICIDLPKVTEQVDGAAVMQTVINDRNIRWRSLKEFARALATVSIYNSIAPRLRKSRMPKRMLSSSSTMSIRVLAKVASTVGCAVRA